MSSWQEKVRKKWWKREASVFRRPIHPHHRPLDGVSQKPQTMEPVPSGTALCTFCLDQSTTLTILYIHTEKKKHQNYRGIKLKLLQLTDQKANADNQYTIFERVNHSRSNVNQSRRKFKGRVQLAAIFRRCNPHQIAPLRVHIQGQQRPTNQVHRSKTKEISAT